MTQCRLFSTAQWLRDDGAEVRRPEPQGCDVEAGFLFDFAIDFATAFDHDDAIQSRPVVALLEPGDIVNHGCRSGLDASVIAVDRLVSTDGGVLEVAGVLLGDEDVDVVTQAALVAFEGENIVPAFLSMMVRAMFALASDGVDGSRWRLRWPSFPEAWGLAMISFDFAGSVIWPV